MLSEYNYTCTHNITQGEREREYIFRLYTYLDLISTVTNFVNSYFTALA